MIVCLDIDGRGGSQALGEQSSLGPLRLREGEIGPLRLKTTLGPDYINFTEAIIGHHTHRQMALHLKLLPNSCVQIEDYIGRRLH